MTGAGWPTAIAQALSRAIITINDNEVLKQLALLCAAGLFVLLPMLTYGVDLNPGLFQYRLSEIC